MNRPTQPAPATAESFGLIAWLEQTRVVLPLKGIECRFAACGDLLEVEIDQVFHQNNRQALDCLYSFPLPGDAAVYRCEMHVNGRIIRARVEEVERARAIFKEKKAAGHRAALVETERKNLFTLSLGNLQPGDLVVIRLAYFQTLTRLADWTSFNIPFCPGIRYIPGVPLLRAPSGRGAADDTDQVPDASRISPPRMDRLHPDAAYLAVEGRVEHAPGMVRDISSPSHPVLVRDGDKVSTVTLADQAAMPDSDFVVRWTESKPAEVASSGWVCRDGQYSYALLRLVAPAAVQAEDTEGQDVYFLVDRSGSMEGMKWEKAAQAFREFLKVLGPKDRVWATFFEDRFQDLAEKPLSPAALLADAGVVRLERLGTGGGTELLPALEHVLGNIRKHSGGRRVSLLLITDGEVGNEAAIIERMKGHPTVRLHAFGIDTTVNDAFLKDLAAQQRGTCHLVIPRDDIAGTVARLGERLRRPALRDLTLDGGWAWPGNSAPDLHAGEVLSIPLRSEGRAARITVSGQAAGGRPWRCEVVAAETSMPAIGLLWAQRQINHLLSHGQREEALTLARQHNLVCQGAAFIAWDEAERVAVSAPERLLYQPAMEPAAPSGFSIGKCARAASFFGDAEVSDLYLSKPDETRLGFRLGRHGGAWRRAPERRLHAEMRELLKEISEHLQILLPEAASLKLADLLEQWLAVAPDPLAARYADLQKLAQELARVSVGRNSVQHVVGEGLILLDQCLEHPGADALRQQGVHEPASLARGLHAFAQAMEGTAKDFHELAGRLEALSEALQRTLTLLRGWTTAHVTQPAALGTEMLQAIDEAEQAARLTKP